MIRIDRDARGVATVWLARSDKHNAMSGEMIRDLADAAATLGEDPTVRVVVLAAEGKTFCAGADLGWMQAQFEATDAERRAEATALAGMLGAFDALPKPVIARVQGNAFGGGLGLMAVADVAIGADTARFSLTEVRLGIIPATIGPYVVARMGTAAARRFFFSGRVFGAAEACAAGLLARSVSAEDLDTAVEDEIRPCLSAAPGAVAEAKALCRRLSGAPAPEVVAASIDALIARWRSDEAVQGIGAFFDRRTPPWAPGE